MLANSRSLPCAGRLEHPVAAIIHGVNENNSLRQGNNINSLSIEELQLPLLLKRSEQDQHPMCYLAINHYQWTGRSHLT